MERELWRSLYLLARKLGNPWGSWRYSTAEVLGVYFWAVVHDRPTELGDRSKSVAGRLAARVATIAEHDESTTPKTRNS